MGSAATKSAECKTHGHPIQTICTECKQLMCLKCLCPHSEKGCRGVVMDLASYAEKNIVPRFEEMLKDLERQREKLEGSTKAFASTLPEVGRGLLMLKDKTEKLLVGINKALASLEGCDQDSARSPYSTMKSALKQQLNRLKSAVASDNIGYIIETMESHNEVQQDIQPAGDAELRLVEQTNLALARLLETKEFATLGECLQGLVATCRNVFKRKLVTEVTSRFVYGVCDPIGGCKKLCRYDIIAKKISPCIDVPLYCSVLQIGQRIFFSGGWIPQVNTLSEFVEDTNSLVRRASMRYSKSHHTMVATSQTEFMTLGGHDETTDIAYCEEYSINNDAWKILPSLNKAREHPGAVLTIDGAWLYAIGGRDNNGTVERLNMREKKAWEMASLSVGAEISLNSSLAAFQISADEIMIFVGSGKPDCCVYNMKTGGVKRHTQSLKPDSYYLNSVSVIDGDAYVIGGRFGHLHIYRTAEKEIEEVDYHDASS